MSTTTLILLSDAAQRGDNLTAAEGAAIVALAVTSLALYFIMEIRRWNK